MARRSDSVCVLRQHIVHTSIGQKITTKNSFKSLLNHTHTINWFDASLFAFIKRKDPVYLLGISKTVESAQRQEPRGYFEIRKSGGGGGLDLTSSLEAKFGARSGQVHKIRGKIWEVLSPKDAKVGKKSQFWGHI